jgi:hypothetical protein
LSFGLGGRGQGPVLCLRICLLGPVISESREATRRPERSSAIWRPTRACNPRKGRYGVRATLNEMAPLLFLLFLPSASMHTLSPLRPRACIDPGNLCPSGVRACISGKQASKRHAVPAACCRASPWKGAGFQSIAPEHAIAHAQSRPSNHTHPRTHTHTPTQTPTNQAPASNQHASKHVEAQGHRGGGCRERVRGACPLPPPPKALASLCGRGSSWHSPKPPVPTHPQSYPKVSSSEEESEVEEDATTAGFKSKKVSPRAHLVCVNSCAGLEEEEEGRRSLASPRSPRDASSLSHHPTHTLRTHHTHTTPHAVPRQEEGQDAGAAQARQGAVVCMDVYVYVYVCLPCLRCFVSLELSLSAPIHSLTPHPPTNGHNAHRAPTSSSPWRSARPSR